MTTLATLMVRVRFALKPFVYRLVRWRSLDRKSVAARITAIAGGHAETSAIAPPPPHDASNARLLGIALGAATLAEEVTLPLLVEREAPAYVHLWPGEHYRLLAALVRHLKVSLVVEIGTYRGHSALAILPELRDGARLVTFDVVPWSQTTECLLRSSDFLDGRLTQEIADLGDVRSTTRFAELLGAADLIFLDASKDGSLERRILANLGRLRLREDLLVVLDDIRVWNMLGTWREIARPKLDVTSLGHWSGTGLVDWSAPHLQRSAYPERTG
ncbi:MAG: class I SAM-dependent methyltransferase [Chloroflexota bacterium]